MAVEFFDVFQYVIIAVLIALSGLFSGLTLGLLSLDKVGLQIVINGGEPAESEQAKKILPIRRKGNLLLCTLLLGNVAVNALLSILMAEITSGLVGFLVSTASIVIIGEIIPQAVCSRNALLVGAKTRFIVYFFLVVLFPLAYPISVVLDWVLGDELGTIYSRRELQTLLQITTSSKSSDLEQPELVILQGALNFRSKTAGDCMTPIDKVYMLDVTGHLDVATLSEVLSQGFSRIPVYEGERSNIVGLLLAKDLIILNPDDNTPLAAILSLYSRNVPRVLASTTLDRMLSEFRKGHSHIAMVQRVNKTGAGDPFYETMGVISLEDIIEEIIQQEIYDETDPETKVQGDEAQKKEALIAHKSRGARTKLSENEREGVARFLQAQTPFGPTNLSPAALTWLVTHATSTLCHRGELLYQRGQRARCFTLLLGGRVEVRSGADEFVSIVGPFACLAFAALVDGAHIADFTAKALEKTPALQISLPVYALARRATKLAARGRTKRAAKLLSKPPPISHFSPESELAELSTDSADTSLDNSDTDGGSVDDANANKNNNDNDKKARISRRHSSKGAKKSKSAKKNDNFESEDADDIDSDDADDDNDNNVNENVDDNDVNISSATKKRTTSLKKKSSNKISGNNNSSKHNKKKKEETFVDEHATDDAIKNEKNRLPLVSPQPSSNKSQSGKRATKDSTQPNDDDEVDEEDAPVFLSSEHQATEEEMDAATSAAVQQQAAQQQQQQQLQEEEEADDSQEPVFLNSSSEQPGKIATTTTTTTVTKQKSKPKKKKSNKKQQ